MISMGADLEDGEIEDGEIEDEEERLNSSELKSVIELTSSTDSSVIALPTPPRVEPPVIEIPPDIKPKEPSSKPSSKPPSVNRKRSGRNGGDRPSSNHRRPKEPAAVVDDDWAGNVEKAIKAALEKDVGGNDKAEAINEEGSENGDLEERKSKKKKRKKKHRDEDERKDAKKRKKNHRREEEKNDTAALQDDVEMGEEDDDEMMYVRGASPVMRTGGSPPQQDYPDSEQYNFAGAGPFEDPYDSFCDDSDFEEREDFPRMNRRRGDDDRDMGPGPKRGSTRGLKRRPLRGGRGGKRFAGGRKELGVKGRRGLGKRQQRMMMMTQEQGKDSVCIFFMQGKCQKGDDCPYSHDAHPPRKMELCKFYLMDCCAKKDKCLYLHNDFPCKFFHTGLTCFSGERCKFSHGPLGDAMKSVLLKVRTPWDPQHLETAPKEILGDFPRLSREGAAAMLHSRKNRGKGGSGGNSAKIPSLFEIEIPIPAQLLAMKANSKDGQESDNEEGDGTHTPMPSSPKSENNFSVKSKSTKRRDEDKSSRQRDTGEKTSRHRDPEARASRHKDPEEKSSRRSKDGNEEKPSRRREGEEKSSKRWELDDTSSSGHSHFMPHVKQEGEEDREDQRSEENAQQPTMNFYQETLNPEMGDKIKREKGNQEERDRPRREKNWAEDEVKVKREREGDRPRREKTKWSEDGGKPRRERWSEDGAKSRRERNWMEETDRPKLEQNWPEEEDKYRHEKSWANQGDRSRREKNRTVGGETSVLFRMAGYSPKPRRDESPREESRPRSADSGELRMMDIKEEVEEHTEGSKFRGSSDQKDTGDTDRESGTDSNDGNNIPLHLPKKQRELFIRIQQQQREAAISQSQSGDDDDDADNHVEENWYSSDEEGTSLTDVLKNLSKQQQQPPPARPSTPPTVKQERGTPSPPPATGFSKLNLSDLSQIDISESVSKLLSSIRYNLNTTAPGGSDGTVANSNVMEPPSKAVSEQGNVEQAIAPPLARDPRLSRDPRSRVAPPATTNVGLLSPTTSEGRSKHDSRGHTKPSQHEDRARVGSRRSSGSTAPNIYSNAITSPAQTMDHLSGAGDVDLRSLLPKTEPLTMGEAGDMNFRRDVDLRQTQSFGYGDTDLRGSDVDLRKMLGLPFKPAPLHTPATEIDASLTSHPPMPYKVVFVTIPRPDYSALKINISDPQVYNDPRLRKIFKLTAPPTPSPVVAPSIGISASVPRIDPRRARAQAPAPAAEMIQPRLIPSADMYHHQHQHQHQHHQHQQQQHQQQQQQQRLPAGMMPGLGAGPLMQGFDPRVRGGPPGLLGIAPPNFCPPTPRFEEAEDNSNSSDTDLRMFMAGNAMDMGVGWEHGQGEGPHHRWHNNSRRRRRDPQRTHTPPL
uniref:C3H1-type domain-containing protein n=1 Tax=Timema tahoe TaxID=61484 RepID=A0A7R9FPG7_9NEOP|nr:unnamed protein product [Timema tahoe]